MQYKNKSGKMEKKCYNQGMAVGYKTSLGECRVGDSLDLLKTLEGNSVDLVVTSPPFALLRQKSYGNLNQYDYVDWLIEFGKLVYEKLSPTGSFVIDLGAAYNKGVPTYSLYQFRVLLRLCDEVGFHLAQPFYWHNPSALPAPIEWVNKRKLRAKNSVNTIWWLSKTENPKSCISKVLSPYSDRMRKLFQNPDEFVKEDSVARPSGHVMSKASWAKDNGGAIPPNMLQFPNTESNSQYLRFCKLVGIKGHPARFPAQLPEFFIKMLTDEGDLVVDIFGGSNTTGMVAEQMKRKWLSFELNPEYVAGSALRFVQPHQDPVHVYARVLGGEYVDLNESDLTLR